MPTAYFSAVLSASYVPHGGGGVGAGPHTYWRIRYGKSIASPLFYAEVFFKLASVDMSTGGSIVFSTQANTSSLKAANAFDRNPSTDYASADSTGEWIGYHMAASTEIDEIQLTGAASNPTLQAYQYLVETSNDGITWTLQQDFYDAGGPFTAGQNRSFAVSKIDYFQNDDSPHAYWRIRPFHLGVDATYAALLELQFMTDNETLLSTGGTGIGSTPNASFPIANAFDGTTTQWRSANGIEEMWIGYHFASPVTVQKVKINPVSPFIIGFAIEFSDDGIDWLPACEFHDQQGWVTNVTRTFIVSRLTPVAFVTKLSRNLLMRRVGPSVSKIERLSVFKRVGATVSKLSRYIVFEAI